MIGKFTGCSPVGIQNDQPHGFKTENEAQQFGADWVSDEPGVCFRTEWNLAESRCFVEVFIPNPHMAVGWF